MNYPVKRITSRKYNRITKDEAFDICGRRLRPTKPPFAPQTCFDCYYHDGRCELGRNDEGWCVRFRTDWSYSNFIHKKILNDYDWCIKHFREFCYLDKECFFAIYGGINNGE